MIQVAYFFAERIRKVVIACGHTLRIVSLLGSHLFERLELPIVTVVSNLTLESKLISYSFLLNNLLGAGVDTVLGLTGAFRVFAKCAVWHESKEVRTQALGAVANLLVTGTINIIL